MHGVQEVVCENGQKKKCKICGAKLTLEGVVSRSAVFCQVVKFRDRATCDVSELLLWIFLLAVVLTDGDESK